MIDRGILTDHPGLSGTDYVLEGASVRDRFLLAFLLRHDGSLISGWPPAARQPDGLPPLGLSVVLPSPDEEGFSIQESTCEPLSVRAMMSWSCEDGDDV